MFLFQVTLKYFFSKDSNTTFNVIKYQVLIKENKSDFKYRNNTSNLQRISVYLLYYHYYEKNNSQL